MGSMLQSIRSDVDQNAGGVKGDKGKAGRVQEHEGRDQ